MTRYLLKRLGGALLVLLALSVVVYALFCLAPGDPARLACGDRCNTQQVAQVRDQLGLSDSVFAQYAHFLQGVVAGRDYSSGTATLHCDAPCLGFSYQTDQQVTELILERVPATASLALGSMVLWLVIGVGTGLLSALRRGGLTERVLTTLTLAGTSTPVFILGLLLLMVVCAYLQWLSFPTYVPLTDDPERWAWNMLLPWVTLGLFESAKYARLTRSSTLETPAEDHIRTFRAYGVGERAVVGQHALRGAVLTESLFAIPGLGRTLIDGVRVIDLAVVVGVVLVIGAAVVLANVVADLVRGRRPMGGPGMTALVEVKDLTVEFPVGDGELRAVDSLSFELAAGQALGLVGESGSGKSTVAGALLGLHRGTGARRGHAGWPHRRAGRRRRGVRLPAGPVHQAAPRRRARAGSGARRGAPLRPQGAGRSLTLRNEIPA